MGFQASVTANSLVGLRTFESLSSIPSLHVVVVFYLNDSHGGREDFNSFVTLSLQSVFVKCLPQGLSYSPALFGYILQAARREHC